MKYLLHLFLLLFLVGGCANGPYTEAEPENIVVGFSQSGTESNWRKRHTESIIEEMNKEGYEVLYRNGFMNQDRQIQDMRTFIAYKVDMIVFTPIVEDGWDAVLLEAKAAGIPVIVVDRHIRTAEENLYLTHIGPSFKAEGNRAGLYITNHFQNSSQISINILEMKGLAKTSSANFRNEGFTEVISRDSRIAIVASLEGDYIRSKAKDVFRNYIEENGWIDIDVLYSHNDEMTLGILEVMKESGIVPGQDIIIVTNDGQSEMIENLRAGKVNCVVECNPNAGWYVRNTIKRYLNGNTIPDEIYMPETVFSDKGNLDSIPPRDY
ncbi:ABC transporter substrate-binding protein [Trichococcus flocculiformis]|uniref:ABC transporter substrate-binding protein n=1 Tax=Trichococcus flocculiformis TaxID=82803 RepID=UPI002AAB15AB|nr:ABC transporter substrate-binding protein [Trichococcus flocculiformis]